MTQGLKTDLQGSLETATCRICGHEFQYERIKSSYIADLVPTICDPCFIEHEHKDRVERERKRILEVQNNSAGYTQSVCDWPEWNVILGDTRLRDNIGKAIVKGTKLTGNSLWVWSKDSGVCKTYSCISVCRTLLERGVPVLIWEWQKLANTYSQKCSDNRGNEFAKYIRNWKSLLFLDDIGVGPLTERGVELLYDIFNTRYNQRLPTLVTSNNAPDGAHGIASWISKRHPESADRIARRMTNLCKAVEVK